jgi:hypothetical protein
MKKSLYDGGALQKLYDTHQIVGDMPELMNPAVNTTMAGIPGTELDLVAEVFGSEYPNNAMMEVMYCKIYTKPTTPYLSHLFTLAVNSNPNLVSVTILNHNHLYI